MRVIEREREMVLRDVIERDVRERERVIERQGIERFIERKVIQIESYRESEGSEREVIARERES